MSEMNLTVAETVENTAPELLTDDASAVEEISIEELVADLNSPDSGETVEQGDDGPAEDSEEGKKQPETKDTKDKFSRRISAALKNQEGQLIHELGRGKYTRAQIMEAVDEHLARKMHEEDAEISPKAAKKIIEAEARSGAPANAQLDALKAGMKGLVEDGWTEEELRAFVSDESVRDDIAAGKTVRQAARAYERRQRTAPAAETRPAERKRAVPTIKSAGLPAEGNIGEDFIDEMTPEQFAAFRAKVQRARMQGKQVRL